MNRTKVSVLSATFAGRTHAIALGLAAVLAVSPRASAQHQVGAIEGRVQNATNGNYLNNARVSIEGTNIVVFTDEFGDYRLPNVPAGTVRLVVNYSGLESQSAEITVSGGQATTQNFRLGGGTGEGDEIIMLDAFEVAAARETNAAAIAAQEQRYSSSLKNVISSDAFGDVTEGNIGEFMKFLPGVSVDYVAADVRTMAIRGFASNFTSVSVNGARMASAASGSNTRSFEFEQVSINNIARIEVTKSPTPSMPADSLGGAVNLIPKNAFERDEAELKYRLYLSANSEDVNPLAKSPGPMGKSTFKVLPGFDFDYTLPINENFGLVITGLSSNQFNEQHRTQKVWNFAQAGATATNPYMQQYVVQDGPKNSFRDSVSIKADWRLAPGQVLSASIQSNYYKAQFGNRNRTFNAGTASSPTGTGIPVALSWDSDTTIGATNRAVVSGNSSFRDKFGAATAAVVTYRYNTGAWEIDAGLNASKSRSWYRDMANGHFSSMSITMNNESRIEFDNIDEERPQSIRVLNAFGGELDPWALSSYDLATVRGNPLDASDKFVGGDVSAEYKFDLSFPFAVKAGVSTRKQTRDIRRYDATWNYNGLSGTTDKNARFALDDDYSGQDPHWGLPRLQWPDPYLVHEYFVSNPSAFTQTADQQRNAERFRRQNSQLLEERIDSYYLQFETKLLENRLNVVGGVRIEKTKDEGDGLLTNGPAGNLSEVLANTVERGYHTTRSYDDAYPSIHFTYNLTDDLLLRLSYAKTLGRADFSNILPLARVNDEDQSVNDGIGNIPANTIIVNNTGLKPWTADGYDLSLEYYFPKGGVVSAGAFRKDITDFWGSASRSVTAADLEEFGLDPSLGSLDLTIQTRVNAGDARISGFEFNYQQTLAAWGEWARDLNVFANATRLDLEGSQEADFSNFIEKSASWGVTWSKRPMVLSLKWNYRGRQRLAAQTGAQYQSSATGPTFFRQYYAPRTYLDVNFEYKFSKRLTAFANARNILNEAQTLERFNADSPEYSHTYQIEEFGVQYAIGIKGSF